MQKRLYRSSQDEVLAGVCGGIGEYFGIDSTFVRMLWIISIFPFSVGLPLYIVAAIIIPKREEENLSLEEDGANKDLDSDELESMNKEKTGKMLGYALIIIGILLLLERFGVFRWLDTKIVFPVILIIAGIMVLKNAFKR